MAPPIRPLAALALALAGCAASRRAGPPGLVPIEALRLQEESFEDLEPLREALGSARVVMLGEATHGDGGAFLAKARIVRFLMERCGFDVLAFESGIYDMARVDRAMSAAVTAADVRAAAALGLYRCWANAAEMSELLEEVASGKRRGAKLKLAGFDPKLTGPKPAGAPLAEAAARTAAECGMPIDAVGRGRIQQFLDDLDPNEYYRSPGHRDHHREFVEAVAARIGDAAGRTSDPEEARLVHRALSGALRLERWLEGIGPDGGSSADDNRDRIMADQLIALAREQFPDRKIVVWAHNYHVMVHAYTAQTPQAYEALEKRPKAGPMGRHVRRALGADAVYSIGVLSYSGEYSEPTGARRPLPTTPDDSIEGELHQSGHRAAFVNLRGLPSDHPLRRFRPARFYFHEPRTTDWSRPFDGILYIDEMTPATPVATEAAPASAPTK
ncbi:MAG: erythromycin esterase family protein [Planctomycetes bacterium]|nr:erythromycin esterase family protein [Planctomycetota bacterium]